MNSILRRSLFSAPRKRESRREQCAKKQQIVIKLRRKEKKKKKDLWFDIFIRVVSADGFQRRGIFLFGTRNKSTFGECGSSFALRSPSSPLSASWHTLRVVRRGASVRGDALCLRGVTASETGWQWKRQPAAETDRGTARLSALFSFLFFFFYGFEYKLLSDWNAELSAQQWLLTVLLTWPLPDRLMDIVPSQEQHRSGWPSFDQQQQQQKKNKKKKSNFPRKCVSTNVG